MDELGLDRPSSQRNIVAGLISRKDHLELCRHIKFASFDCLIPQSPFKKEEEKYRAMKCYGFHSLDFKVHREFKSLSLAIGEAQNFMAEGHYQIDGIVITLNDCHLHRELGSTAHHPRFKIAFKFQGESKETTIKEISWSISRNGILTPVAQIESVELSGAIISRLTLHNYGMVKQFSLKAGDRIEIIRSGAVIPKFLSKITSSNGQSSASFASLNIPTVCPSCSEKVLVDDIRLRCVNPHCPGMIKERILYFIQKIGIDDLSSRRLDEMIKVKLIATIPDLYRLEKEDFLKLDKCKDKLATKLFESIQKSKKVDLTTFLTALGISGGAYNKLEKIVRENFDTLGKVRAMTKEDLVQIDSFAEKSAEEFICSLQEKIPLIDELLSLGFGPGLEGEGGDATTKRPRPRPLMAQKICITGSLNEKRSTIERCIREAGGQVVHSVSKNTTYLLTNESRSSSSKFKKAMALKIPIIDEVQLKKLIE